MQFVVDIALALLYLAGFLLLCAWAWRFWVMYIQTEYTNSVNKSFILLEIKLPREIDKSPLAAELAISSLLQTSGLGGWFNKYYMGKVPIFSSLEIASIEGVIHFYVRIERRFKTLVESAFYAQYPGIEIVEADDYTKRIRYHHLSKDTNMWGASFTLSGKWTPTNKETGEPYEYGGKPVTLPADYLPMKTYVDFGLDKDPKEEYKIDPLTQILETMATCGKGEHFWYQVLIQDESVFNDTKVPKMYINPATHEHVSLADMVKDRKKQLRTASWVKKGDVSKTPYGIDERIVIGYDSEGKSIYGPAVHPETKAVGKKEMDLTSDDKGEIEAMDTKLSKPLARVVVRIVYAAETQHFNKGHVVTVLTYPKLFKGANGLAVKTIADPYDYPWQGIRRVGWRKEEIFERYVEREGFNPHVGIDQRKKLDYFEDNLFWLSTMKARRLFRMVYEAIFHPFDHPPHSEVSVMNLEEVATLWHLPGRVAGTPMLPRIDSTKVMAPPNLPH
jgi:hypothetical protein